MLTDVDCGDDEMSAKFAVSVKTAIAGILHEPQLLGCERVHRLCDGYHVKALALARTARQRSRSGPRRRA